MRVVVLDKDGVVVEDVTVRYRTLLRLARQVDLLASATDKHRLAISQIVEKAREAVGTFEWSAEKK